MPFGGNDWLALTQESTLEPEIPICDPHHHLWDLRPARVSVSELPAARAIRRLEQWPQRAFHSVCRDQGDVPHRWTGRDASSR